MFVSLLLFFLHPGEKLNFLSSFLCANSGSVGISACLGTRPPKKQVPRGIVTNPHLRSHPVPMIFIQKKTEHSKVLQGSICFTCEVLYICFQMLVFSTDIHSLQSFLSIIWRRISRAQKYNIRLSFKKTQLAVDKDDDQPKRRKTLHLPFPFNPAIPGLSMISVFTLAKEV